MYEFDSELQEKNYERELKLCEDLGGDVSLYRRLAFDVLQLEQIRLGLEHKVDVEKYSDPELSWMEMEDARLGLESGIDMSKYEKAGFSHLQCHEIRLGLQAGVDVSCYDDEKYFSLQMQEIRKGLVKGIDVSVYANPDFDWMQMKEIRIGLERGLDVSQYASLEYKYSVMRAIREALEQHRDIVDYAKKGYSGKALHELNRGLNAGNDLSSFLEKGYQAEQLEQINNAFEAGVNLLPYLSEEFHGAQLQEMLKGLKKNLDISRYAKKCYNWFQMRELRFGLEDKIDVTPYENPDFSAQQMAEIRKGIIEGLDVSEYAKIYYDPEQMAEIRSELGTKSSEVDSDLKNMIVGMNMEQDSDEYIEDESDSDEDKPVVEIHTREDEELLDSCVTVADDKMSVTLCLAPVQGIYQNLKVPDIMRVLKHHDIKQGILRDKIFQMLNNKDYESEIVVAEAKQPVQGQDGRFRYFFRKHGRKKPKLREDGSVDYKDMDLFEVVKKGQLIAEYVPATTGAFGYDVLGNLLTPHKGKELAPIHGKGFIMSEDRRKYYSDMDGIIEMSQEGTIEIRNVYTVNGDVDASVGNVNFNGDIHVMGNVQPGFMVTATGNVVIAGQCEGGIILAGKDIILNKGCQGQGIGRLEASGSISGKFFESVSIFAGGDVHAAYLLNCELNADGKVLVEGRRGVILGGYVCAKQGVNCHAIGNVAEIRTTVEVGVGKDEMTAYQELMKHIEKVNEEISTCEIALEKFMTQPEHDAKASQLCERLTKAIYSEKMKKKSLLEERQKMTAKIMVQKAARVSVSGSVYPGVRLYMNSELLVVREEYSNVQFVKRESKIDVFSK